MTPSRDGDRSFSNTVGVAFVVKLWLTSQTRIIAAYAPEDASNYLEHAKSIAMGQWFGPYDSFTLIKQPFFPLYMAALQEFGIPLPIAHLLFYGLACYVACIAVKPLVRQSFLLGAMFVVLYFNPMENNDLAWSTVRVQTNGALALLAIACAIGLFVRRRGGFRATLPWAIGLGASFAAFWLNREEAVWMVPALAILFVAYLYPVVRERRWRGVASRLGSAGVSFGVVVAAVGSIMLVNGILYGWYATCENMSPELISAYDALARIDPLVRTDRHFPVPHAAREIAYRVSPAAKELAPYLDGPPAVPWKAEGCEAFHVCGDIHGGWFIWALRDAISVAGHYKTGADARAFYLRLAREIDAACDAGTIACRRKGHTLSPPLTPADVVPLAANLVPAIRVGLDFEQFIFDPPYYVGPDSIRPDYDFVVRSVDDGYGKEPTAWDDGAKRAILIEIAQTYQVVFPYWVALSFVFVAVRTVMLVRGRSRTDDEEAQYLIPAASLVAGFASLAFVLALVATLSFPAIDPEYTGPLFPFVILFVSLITAVEAPGYVHALGERLPAAQA